MRAVWIQRTGEAAYVQRHLPAGGAEIHLPVGHPQLVGPLTGPEIEVIPARTAIVGVRFQPGTGPGRHYEPDPARFVQGPSPAAYSLGLMPGLADFGDSLHGELFRPLGAGYIAWRADNPR